MIQISFPRQRLDCQLLLQWLNQDGVVSDQEMERVRRRMDAVHSAEHPLLRLGSANLSDARDGGAVDTEMLTRWLANKLAMHYLHIDPLKVDVARVTEVMSIRYAETRRALPIAVSPTEVTVATYEPLDTDWVAEIEAHTKKRLKLVLAHPLQIQHFTTEFYTLAHSVRAAAKNGATPPLTSFEQLVDLGRSSTQVDANDSAVKRVVDWLWQYAFDQRASDIHLEPRRSMGVIRFRIDGMLHTVYQVPTPVMTAMIARIKLLARMDVAEKRRPLDGRVKTVRPRINGQAGRDVEMRMATLPTAFGEKMVMRIFDPDTAAKGVGGLGFGARESERWAEVIGRPHGIILVTGPTGSGKTTTLYATLKRLATDEVNICTIEDPIEMIEPVFNQTQVQGVIDFGFADGLRALMRQDPDIIMVGEIRDLETAQMAIQAALTGHLVFSTLHTNDAAAAVTRLIDLGVPPFLISATVIGVLAQRLVRTLCPSCKQLDPSPSSAEILRHAIHPWELRGLPSISRPVGCLECRMTGYRGRAGLYELIVMTPEAREHVQKGFDEARFRRQAVADGMYPLRAAGAMKVAQGVTTLEEVLRSTPEWEKPSLPDARPRAARLAALPAPPSTSASWRTSSSSRARDQLSDLIGSGQFLTQRLDAAFRFDDGAGERLPAADAFEALESAPRVDPATAH
jgi:general secretion pathway protein E